MTFLTTGLDHPVKRTDRIYLYDRKWGIRSHALNKADSALQQEFKSYKKLNQL